MQNFETAFLPFLTIMHRLRLLSWESLSAICQEVIEKLKIKQNQEDIYSTVKKWQSKLLAVEIPVFTRICAFRSFKFERLRVISSVVNEELKQQNIDTKYTLKWKQRQRAIILPNESHNYFLYYHHNTNGHTNTTMNA